MAVPQSLFACIFRSASRLVAGFSWPLMRRRLVFLASTAIMTVVWWIYYVRAYLRWVVRIYWRISASRSELLGFVLPSACLPTVAVDLAERVCPRFPNALFETYFSSSGSVEDRVFSGSRYLLGDSAGWERRACSFSSSG